MKLTIASADCYAGAWGNPDERSYRIKLTVYVEGPASHAEALRIVEDRLSEELPLSWSSGSKR